MANEPALYNPALIDWLSIIKNIPQVNKINCESLALE